jgi:methylated-DNA-[protein]-cysteine S-methyltransferase
MAIPRGCTESYGSLARKIGAPGAARAVGTACKMNPIPLFVPCHRVVRQNGSIGEFALGKDNKEYLLAMESK